MLVLSQENVAGGMGLGRIVGRYAAAGMQGRSEMQGWHGNSRQWPSAADNKTAEE